MSRWLDSRMPKNEIKQLRVRDIPNIGPVIEKGLIPLNLNEPAELIGKEPRRHSSNVPSKFPVHPPPPCPTQRDSDPLIPAP